jgi:hypothetical protein
MEPIMATIPLAEIKARWADGTLGYTDYAALGAAAVGKADVDQLVGEVERLRGLLGRLEWIEVELYLRTCFWEV